MIFLEKAKPSIPPTSITAERKDDTSITSIGLGKTDRLTSMTKIVEARPKQAPMIAPVEKPATRDFLGTSGAFLCEAVLYPAEALFSEDLLRAI
jgi:hypothetical protein